MRKKTRTVRTTLKSSVTKTQPWERTRNGTGGITKGERGKQGKPHKEGRPTGGTSSCDRGSASINRNSSQPFSSTTKHLQRSRDAWNSREGCHVVIEFRTTIAILTFSHKSLARTTECTCLEVLPRLRSQVYPSAAVKLEPKWLRSVVVVEWLYYSKRIIIVRWADLSIFH